MKYSIIGTGSVGITLAGFFAKNLIPVAVANTRGPSAVSSSIKGLGDSVRPSTVEEALDADIIFLAVQFLNFKDVGKLRSDWSGKIVVDVTNSAFLPPEVQERELKGRLSSEVNADRVPGAKLVKAYNQLPMQGLTAPVPAGGRRVVFISSDHADASAAVASLTENLGFAPIDVGRIAEGGRLIQARNALVFQNLIKF
ncbi:NAD(P)-binding domain-containing protein (plasmid) [Agrobacterium tumefaciens]|uniref:NAD(P)-binding domain-containing protein n=1 Tax=Agrobacterium tumefaciens TaxID=358 RepID=A0AAJ4N8H3_AGRTU|nr:NAD(P)-binding domain-containing protein [Agrobacterium tumefaciens]